MCRTCYTPQQKVSVDEELVLFRGRVAFRQYIPAKKARYGIKVYCLCEAATGYMSNFLIHSTREQNAKFGEDLNCGGLSMSEKVVAELCRQILGLGYHVHSDSWFTSLRLATFLLQQSTLLIGTVRADRGVPLALRQKVLQPPNSAFMRSGGALAVKMVTRKTSGVKTVYFLDTKNAARYRYVRQVGRGGQEEFVRKPVTAVEYSASMEGVDRLDATLQPYCSSRKSHKWFAKLAQHLFLVMVRNAWVMYRSCGGSLPFLKFLDATIKDFIQSTGAARKRHPRGNGTQPGNQQHFISRLIPTAAQTRPSKRCRQCYSAGRVKKTVFCCCECEGKPGLCPEPCFQEWHARRQ